MIEAICSEPPALLEFIFATNPTCAAYLSSPIEMVNASLLTYLSYFGMTCLLETPGYLAGGLWAKQKPPRIFIQILVLNLATHPIVFWFAPWALEKLHQSTGSYLFWGELFAFSVEAILLRKWAKYSWSLAITTSTAANLTSWWFGLYLVNQGIL